MSYLAVDIFDDTTPSFDIKVNIKELTSIKYFRIHILKVGTLQDGTLQLSLLQGGDTIATQSLNYLELNEISDINAHGMLTFEFDNAISVNLDESNEEQELNFKLEMLSHTEDSNNYFGLVKDFEHRVRDIYGTNSESGDNWVNPYEVEIWSVKR